jgi:cobalt/nickel transport system permease protein
MAFVIPFLGYAIYRLAKACAKTKKGEYAALAIASYVAIDLAALCAAIEFGLQPLVAKDAAGLPLFCPYPLSVSIPAMLIPHLAAAGIVEAAFTVAILAFIAKASPGTVYSGSPAKTRPLYALIVALVVASPLGLLAAGRAWGEWGPEEIRSVVSAGSPLGFVPQGMRKGIRFEAPFPDYASGGVPEVVGYVVSAILGAAVLVVAFKLLGLLKKGSAGAEG